MSKIWVISIGAVILIGLILAFWLTALKSQTPAANSPAGQNVELPVAGSVGPTTVTSTSIQGAKDFINDPATAKDPINPGYYYLGYHVNEGVPDPTATNNPPYIIEYISATQYFNIGLLSEPIGPVRLEAEQFLMNSLGISESQMCKLNYMISVPESVNSQFAGMNLGFSFCPGATVLPK
jgi:hypothetical protein